MSFIDAMANVMGDAAPMLGKKKKKRNPMLGGEPMPAGMPMPKGKGKPMPKGKKPFPPKNSK